MAAQVVAKARLVQTANMDTIIIVLLFLAHPEVAVPPVPQ
jgi:hypothetical protein